MAEIRNSHWVNDASGHEMDKVRDVQLRVSFLMVKLSTLDCKKICLAVECSMMKSIALFEYGFNPFLSG